MTDLVLFFRSQLRGTAVQAGGQEDRVVAEAASAARLERNHALPLAVCDDGVGVVGFANKHDDAVVACLAKLGVHAVHLGQQFLQVFLISRIFAGEACGVDAGAAAEAVDFDAGIVGDGRQLRHSRGVARLYQSVFDERRPRLRH